MPVQPHRLCLPRRGQRQWAAAICALGLACSVAPGRSAAEPSPAADCKVALVGDEPALMRVAALHKGACAAHEAIRKAQPRPVELGASPSAQELLAERREQERIERELTVLRRAMSVTQHLHLRLRAESENCSKPCPALTWWAEALLPAEKALKSSPGGAEVSAWAAEGLKGALELRAKASSRQAQGNETLGLAQALGDSERSGPEGRNIARDAFDGIFAVNQGGSLALSAANALVSLDLALNAASREIQSASQWSLPHAGALQAARLLGSAVAREASERIEVAALTAQASAIGRNPEERAQVAQFLRAAQRYPDAGLLLGEEGFKYTASSDGSEAKLKINIDMIGRLINQQTSVTFSSPVGSSTKRGLLYASEDGMAGVPNVRVTSSVVRSLEPDRWFKGILSILGVSGSWGQKEFNHIDAASIDTPISTKVNPWSLGGFWTVALAKGGGVVTMRSERQRLWKPADESIICTDPNGSDFKCVSGAPKAPKALFTTVSSVEWRGSLGPIDVAARAIYDRESKQTRYELPLYFIGTSGATKRSFSGGIVLGHDPVRRSWAGVFVGAPLEMISR